MRLTLYKHQLCKQLMQKSKNQEKIQQVIKDLKSVMEKEEGKRNSKYYD